MTPTLRVNSADALAVLTLLSTSFVIAWPILTGGYLTYVDNAPHIAEIFDLARGVGNGWSELSFTGFALGNLHSPLWYGALVFLARAGAPINAIYTTLLLVGFVAPALSIYAVARRRVGIFAAAVLAYIVLVQAPMITGIGSPLGGMWTHSIAVAGVVLFADLCARPELDARQHFLATVLLALLTLTHLFALVAALLVILLASVLRAPSQPLSRKELGNRAVGYSIAALISADYWLSFLLTTRSDAAPMDMLDPAGLGCRLLLPCDVMYLLDERLLPAVRADLYLTDALPMVGLLVLGFLGASRRRRSDDSLGRIGFQLGCVVFVALLVHRYHTIELLGPVSWRLLLWVPLGFALSALRWLAKFRERRPRRMVAVGLAVAGTALGAWWGLPLRRDMPADMAGELSTLNELSKWLATHAEPEWGRIYLQDTFGHRWEEAGLSHSHLLVLTARETHLAQLGTYYGVVPYRTRWTLSEFNALYGQWRPSIAAVIEGMEKTNAGIFVSSNAHSAQWVAQSGQFREIHHTGRYTVFRRVAGSAGWIDGLRPSNHISAVDFRPGSVAFDVSSDFPRGRVLVKTTWHPWWKISGIPGARLIESPEGFLVVDRIPRGRFRVRLWYQPSSAPSILSWSGVLLLLAWTFISIRKNRPSAAAPTAATPEGLGAA